MTEVRLHYPVPEEPVQMAQREISATRHGALRAIAAACALVTCAGAISCRDAITSGPGLPVRAAISLSPVYEASLLQGGAPPLVSVRAILHSRSGRMLDSAVAKFERDTASLQFEVLISGDSEVFVVTLAGVDANGDTLYRGADSVRAYARSVDREPKPVPLMLHYAGPDSSLASLRLTPRETELATSDTLRFSVTGLSATGAPVAPFRVVWTLLDESAGSISEAGTLSPRNVQRVVRVVARTLTGHADTATVTLRARAGKVRFPTPAIGVPRGEPVQLLADVLDDDEAALANRAVAWKSLDAAAVSVDAAGVMHGLELGATVAVTATADGVSDTVMVTVLPRPVGEIRIDPLSPVVLTAGTSMQMKASLLDPLGVVNPDHTVQWISGDTAVARITADGVVHALSTGLAKMLAAAGGRNRYFAVAVFPPGYTLHLEPPVLQVAVGSTATISIVARDASGVEIARYGDVGIEWSSLDPGIASVSGRGVVTGLSPGKVRIQAGVEGGRFEIVTVTVVTP